MQPKPQIENSRETESVPLSEAIAALLEIRKYASGCYHPAFALAHIFDISTRASRGEYQTPVAHTRPSAGDEKLR